MFTEKAVGTRSKVRKNRAELSTSVNGRRVLICGVGISEAKNLSKGNKVREKEKEAVRRELGGGEMGIEEDGGGSCTDEEAIAGGVNGGIMRKKGGWKRLGDFQRDLVTGAVMGGLVHTVVAPIERAKLLLQTQEGNAAILGLTGHARRVRFRGMVDCIVRTVREEGVLSLWRGNGTSVLRYYPSVALNFSLKDLYKGMLRGGGEGSMSWSAGANFVAGAGAGCTTLVLIYPLDIAHTRLAADVGKSGSRQFRGIRHFLRSVYGADGIRGIYRGLPASLHGMVIHRGLYFGGFDTAKEFLVSEDSALWRRWAAAQLVTTMAGLISYPFDTVRRRMMMQSGMGGRIYANTLDCWAKIYAAEGPASFYRGAVSNMFRGTGAAAILVLYDELKKFMKCGAC